ncbi:MAG TPA: murein L,D-transpeptidase family protein [Xanthobacteraceae bacterium]|nr:murein L,D-transpeptidase family protein [Xanthobacteraceae bacterium]
MGTGNFSAHFLEFALKLRRPKSAIRFAAATAVCGLLLSGCSAENFVYGADGNKKHLRPISAQTASLMQQKGMTKESPILLRIYKEESELEIWKKTTAGRYELLKKFPICKWSGELGPKIKTGDRQAPEGFYFIRPEQMNPHSSYHLAFNLGFPNDFDRAHNRTGSHLMVHGDCSSSGCYAMTDEQIADIFALAREAFDGGQLAFQVQAFPFRMTNANMTRHRNNPNQSFWRMLKEGSDHFEVTRQEPKIDVCNRRYIFNAVPDDPMKPFDPSRPCPSYHLQPEIAQLLQNRQNADKNDITSLFARSTPAAPVRTNNDGGSNPAFAGRVPMSSVQAAAEADAVEEDDDAPRPAAKQKQRKQSKQAPKKNSKQQETQSPSANQTTSLNSVAPFRPANGRFDSYAQ